MVPEAVRAPPPQRRPFEYRSRIGLYLREQVALMIDASSRFIRTYRLTSALARLAGGLSGEGVQQHWVAT